MKLKKLLKDLDVEIKGSSRDIEITNMTSNSKLVGPGNLFVAKKGMSHDGVTFIPDAIASGAVAILTDLYNPFLTQVSQVIAKDVVEVEAILAKRFFADPSSHLYTVGITGTCGKTTSSFYTKYVLDGEAETGLMGTIETIIGDLRFESTLTTPDVISTQKILRDMVNVGLKQGVIEISSHALSQKRVFEVSLDIAVFLNLTPEHLDYHETMEAYFLEKRKIFDLLKPGGKAIIGIDCPYGQRLLREREACTFGLSSAADISASSVRYTIEGASFILHTPLGSVAAEIPYFGDHNVCNALVAVAVALQKGMDLAKIVERLASLPPVAGRMEKVENERGVHVYVDFAHKESALEEVLKSLRNVASGKITTVFGCGGNRDREKRPKMAEIAERYSNYVIVTSDNPRKEEPSKIAEEIVAGFREKNFSIILDRKEAIGEAIARSDPGDVVLIAGRGHERHQIFAGQIQPFSDVQVAKEIVNILT